MCKRTLLLKALTGLVVLAPLALGGCGASNPYDYGDPASSGFGYGLSTSPSALGTTTVAYGSSPYGTTPDGTVTPVPAASVDLAPTTASDATGVVDGSTGASLDASTNQGLLAEVSNVRNGLIFGLGTCKVTVIVSNPDSVAETGTLTVTFTKKGQPTSDVQSQPVSLKANETQTLTFSDKKWSISGATATVTTDPTSATSSGSASTVN